MFGADYAYMSLVKADDGIYIVFSENLKADKGNSEVDGANFPVKGNNFYLQVIVEKGGVCRFAFSEDGEKFTIIAKTFTAKPGRWVGAKIGLFCTRTNITNDAGFADVDWIHFEK